MMDYPSKITPQFFKHAIHSTIHNKVTKWYNVAIINMWFKISNKAGWKT